MEKKKFYMTTAIAYASGKPHIGNTYEVVLADSIARYKRFTTLVFTWYFPFFAPLIVIFKVSCTEFS